MRYGSRVRASLVVIVAVLAGACSQPAPTPAATANAPATDTKARDVAGDPAYAELEAMIERLLAEPS